MSSLPVDTAKEYFDAIDECDTSKVESLLSSGLINVDLKNPTFYDRTALHTAACNGDIELVQLLINNFNASINITDLRGQIPLEIATDYRNIDIVKFLIQKGSNNSEYAAPYLNTEEVEALFEAARANDIAEVTRLINENGLDVDTEDRSDSNRTVLEVAATNGYYDLVRVLVDEFHADVNHNDDLEESPLVMAMNNKHDNVANFLLERGATRVLEDSSEDSDFSFKLPID
ncbi:Receptor-interacting serine/threonine-protein kinase 4 [Papilio xuthus]|uniref:Receptor-interacting serine/threonine-protein kinase 4 n=1 Tax=Papilio xuthus TaxID=66420 RepID=A0A194Q060_PAPXU|nr:Receptor-interacting serine/threonine-protein kinase 4 [Papilio xuthus]